MDTPQSENVLTKAENLLRELHAMGNPEGKAKPPEQRISEMAVAVTGAYTLLDQRLMVVENASVQLIGDVAALQRKREFKTRILFGFGEAVVFCLTAAVINRMIYGPSGFPNGREG